MDTLLEYEAQEEVVPVYTKEKLTKDVEALVKRDHMTYLEAIIHVCDDLEIEAEDMAKIVSGPLRDKLEAEAQRNNILPKPNDLFSNL
jgi:hypothetical protein